MTNKRAEKRLRIAARGGKLRTVKRLASKDDVDVNGADASGDTALHMAAGKGHIPVVKLLLELGASPLVRNGERLSAVDAAVAQSQTSMIAYLHTFEPVREETSRARADGELTPLVTAAKLGALRALVALLREGHDPNACRCPDGRYPLHWAAARGHTELVDALLAAGAAPGALSSEGETAMQVASSGSIARLVRIALEQPPPAPVLVIPPSREMAELEATAARETLERLYESAPATVVPLKRKKRRKPSGKK